MDETTLRKMAEALQADIQRERKVPGVDRDLLALAYDALAWPADIEGSSFDRAYSLLRQYGHPRLTTDVWMLIEECSSYFRDREKESQRERKEVQRKLHEACPDNEDRAALEWCQKYGAKISLDICTGEYVVEVDLGGPYGLSCERGHSLRVAVNEVRKDIEDIHGTVYG